MGFVNQLGNEIGRRRAALSMSRRTFANKIGVSEDTVRAWEVGLSAPRMSLIPEISKVLHCKPADLFSFDTDEEATKDTGDLLADQIMEMMLSLSDMQKTLDHEFPDKFRDTSQYREMSLRLDAVLLWLRDSLTPLVSYYTDRCVDGETDLPVGDYTPERFDEHRYDIHDKWLKAQGWKESLKKADGERCIRGLLLSMDEEWKKRAMPIIEKCRADYPFTKEEYDQMDLGDRLILHEYGKDEAFLAEEA